MVTGVHFARAAGVLRVPRRRSRRHRSSAGYWFVLPFVVSYAVFFVLPSVVSLALSFARYRGFGPLTWTGLDNYRSLFSYPLFWSSLQNSLAYWLLPMIPTLGGALLLAVAAHGRIVRWQRTFQSLVFLPQVLAPVAAALVFRIIFATQNGVINQAFHTDVGWLSEPWLTKLSVSVLISWRGVGWYFAVFLAGLTRIPREVTEAAAVDGAGVFRRFFHITLPLMRPILLFAVVIHTVVSMRLYAEPTLLTTGSGDPTQVPDTASPLMNLLVVNVEGGGYGLAAALGWVMFLVITVLSVIEFRMLGRED